MKMRGPSKVQVRLGVLDRLIQPLSPAWAQRRYQARIKTELLRRSYDAADKGVAKSGWRAGASSADSEIAVAGAVLRQRSRDLVRNNPLAAQAVQVLVNNLVGYGIRPRAASGNKARDKKVNAAFEAWAASCDIHGHTNFYGLQALAVREMIEGGDLFAMRRPLRGVGKVPLAIELFEADHLDESRMSLADSGARISQGIEYDINGRRRGYWMFPQHPGDGFRGSWMSLSSVFVPASMVTHVFERQRVQSRGVPWGTPAMTALQHLGDWQDAELTRKKIEASVAAFVIGDVDESEQGIAPTVVDSEGETIDQLEPGIIAFLRGGKDVKFNTPGATPGMRDWNLVQMLIIAAGYRVPYALMTGDLAQANYSSNRAALNEFRRMIQMMQESLVIPMFCQPIWDWFCEAAWTAGIIDTPIVPVKWDAPKFESVNPWQDAQTDRLEVRAGLASLAQKISARGYDPVAVLTEQAELLKIVDALGLILDSDPRKTAGSGQGQAMPGEDAPPPAVSKDT